MGGLGGEGSSPKRGLRSKAGTPPLSSATHSVCLPAPTARIPRNDINDPSETMARPGGFEPPTYGFEGHSGRTANLMVPLVLLCLGGVIVTSSID